MFACSSAIEHIVSTPQLSQNLRDSPGFKQLSRVQEGSTAIVLLVPDLRFRHYSMNTDNTVVLQLACHDLSMNKVLVVMPYKLWFLQQQHYKRSSQLASSCSRKLILGTVIYTVWCWWSFKLIN